jgi:hypothetical protein
LGSPGASSWGYIITKHDIEEKLDKILAITKIDQVRGVKDVQWLMGCLVVLSRFVSRLGEHGLPLYKLLKKSDFIRWMDEM